MSPHRCPCGIHLLWVPSDTCRIKISLHTDKPFAPSMPIQPTPRAWEDSFKLPGGAISHWQLTDSRPFSVTIELAAFQGAEDAGFQIPLMLLQPGGSSHCCCVEGSPDLSYSSHPAWLWEDTPGWKQITGLFLPLLTLLGSLNSHFWGEAHFLGLVATILFKGRKYFSKCRSDQLCWEWYYFPTFST